MFHQQQRSLIGK